MQKGISPIVAVVLLIAIAVIAAVGLYFWVGGLATQQPTPSKPKVLSAQGLTCGVTNTTKNCEWATVMVQNLDPAAVLNEALYITADHGPAWQKTATNISYAAQKVINFTEGCGNFTVGSTYVIYGIAGVSQAQFVVPSGLCGY
jgi:flagellin-like protein